jgi:hypothetical protein
MAMIRVVLVDLEGLLDAGAARPNAREALAALGALQTSPGKALALGLLPSATPRAGRAEQAARERLRRAGLDEPFRSPEAILPAARPGAAAPDRTLLEEGVRRLDAKASLGACAAVLADERGAAAFIDLSVRALALGRDCAGWRDVPMAVARLIDPTNLPNLGAALAARLGPDLEDVAVVRVEGDRIVARARAWSVLPAGGAIPEPIHVKVPVEVEVRLDAKGVVASVVAGALAPEDVAEAASYAEGLFARREVAFGPGRPPPGATHVLERDAGGRRLLRRARYSTR